MRPQQSLRWSGLSGATAQNMTSSELWKTVAFMCRRGLLQPCMCSGLGNPSATLRVEANGRSKAGALLKYLKVGQDAAPISKGVEEKDGQRADTATCRQRLQVQYITGLFTGRTRSIKSIWAVTGRYMKTGKAASSGDTDLTDCTHPTLSLNWFQQVHQNLSSFFKVYFVQKCYV